jgi:hypothetical protein
MKTVWYSNTHVQETYEEKQRKNEYTGMGFHLRGGKETPQQKAPRKFKGSVLIPLLKPMKQTCLCFSLYFNQYL